MECGKGRTEDSDREVMGGDNWGGGNGEACPQRDGPDPPMHFSSVSISFRRKELFRLKRFLSDKFSTICSFLALTVFCRGFFPYGKSFAFISGA